MSIVSWVISPKLPLKGPKFSKIHWKLGHLMVSSSKNCKDCTHPFFIMLRIIIFVSSSLWYYIWIYIDIDITLSVFIFVCSSKHGKMHIGSTSGQSLFHISVNNYRVWSFLLILKIQSTDIDLGRIYFSHLGLIFSDMASSRRGESLIIKQKRTNLKPRESAKSI